MFQLCFSIPIPTASAAKSLFIIMRFSGLPETNAAIASRGRHGFPWQNELCSWIRRIVPRMPWFERSLLHLFMREQSQAEAEQTGNSGFREAGWSDSSTPHVTETQQCWYRWFNYCHKSLNNFHKFYAFRCHQTSKAWSGPFKMAFSQIFGKLVTWLN